MFGLFFLENMSFLWGMSLVTCWGIKLKRYVNDSCKEGEFKNIYYEGDRTVGGYEIDFGCWWSEY